VSTRFQLNYLEEIIDINIPDLVKKELVYEILSQN
jgi:hypothetical protein